MIELLVVHFTLTLIRVAAFVAFLPPTSGKNLPNLVKVGLAVALTLVVGMPTGLESLPMLVRAADAWPAFAFLAIRETVYGIGLAMCLGLVLMPARIAGAYIAQEMGLTIATLTGPSDDQQTSIVGVILEMAAAMLFFSLNLHLAVIAFLNASFQRFPAGTASLEFSPGAVLHQVAASIEAGLLIAAPVGIVLMLALIGSLVLMRSVPQFNLFSIGMSVRIVAGLGALLIFAPETMVLIRQSLQCMMPWGGG
ncbi:MAG: flagellar biosynthetic protein FliR [Planctomycetaceae bacterium]|nr:flagellar biosynthetic protein FliR [Planctomycetaceae bacterium]